MDVSFFLHGTAVKRVAQLSQVWLLRHNIQHLLTHPWNGRSSLVVRVSDRSWLVTSSSPVPLKTRRVGERCQLNLSRAQTSSRWCGVVVRRGSVILVT
ncbi:hypothetical protein TNCV_2126671 [Trichonephila clavipes]|nr:hypothetical protein TNCV_2126671 [Trichonephila clavipes]